MGILNVTPDSFSDGGRWLDPARAVERASQMTAEGATIIDVGGESTRPGSAGVDEGTERERVVPVIERIAASLDVAISIDSSKVPVMAAAVAAGACIVNDVKALSARGARLVERRVPALLRGEIDGSRERMEVDLLGDSLRERARLRRFEG